jgi:hypothetical protein
MNVQEVGWGKDRIGVAQSRNRLQFLVNVVMNLRVPYNAKNFLTNGETVSFSSMTFFYGLS